MADVAERMQCPPDFVAVPLLVAAASGAVAVAVAPAAQAQTIARGPRIGYVYPADYRVQRCSSPPRAGTFVQPVVFPSCKS